MKDEKKENEKFAEKNYKALCKFLKSKKWKFEEEKENFKVHIDFEFDNSKIYVVIGFNIGLGTIYAFSKADDLEIPESKQSLIAAAVLIANGKMTDGNFDYKCLNGKIIFRITSCYIGTVLSDSLYEYLISNAYYAVKDYHKKFAAVCTAQLTTLGQLKNLISSEGV